MYEKNKKSMFSLTLDPDLVDDLRLKRKITNLSGWVNEQIRLECCKRAGSAMACPKCSCLASAEVWARWRLSCMECGTLYKSTAELKQVMEVGQ